jgi:N-acetylneuraminate synthase
LVLLHCVSGYPTPPEQSNLAAIATMRERFSCPTGWSDHTGDEGVVLRAVRHWDAAVVEMHVDLDSRGHEAGEHNWTPARIARVKAILDAPVEDGVPGVQAMDGDGRKRPMPVEASDVAWRADPTDGLRPLRLARAALAG